MYSLDVVKSSVCAKHATAVKIFGREKVFVVFKPKVTYLMEVHCDLFFWSVVQVMRETNEYALTKRTNKRHRCRQSPFLWCRCRLLVIVYCWFSAAHRIEFVAVLIKLATHETL